MIDISLEVSQPFERRCVPFGSKTYAWEEPATVDLRAIRTLNQPLVSAFIECSTVNMLVVYDVFADVPLFVNIFEVSANFFASGVPLLESKVLVQVLLKKLVDRGSRVHAGARLR